MNNDNVAFCSPYFILLGLLNRETEDFRQRMTWDRVKYIFAKFRVKVKAGSVQVTQLTWPLQIVILNSKIFSFSSTLGASSSIQHLLTGHIAYVPPR
jgi:hypothetical protein